MRRLAAVVSVVLGLCLVAGLAWAQLSIEGQIKAVLDAWVAKPPGQFTSFRYGSATFDLATRKTVVTDFELAGGPAEKVERVKVGRIELVDFNPLMIQKIADSATYRDGKGDGAFARIAGQVQLLTFEMTGKNRLRVREMLLSEFFGRQFDTAPSSFSKDEPAKTVGLLLPAFRVSALDVFGLEMRDGKGGGVNIDRFAVTGVDAGRFANFTTDRLAAYENDLETVVVNQVTVRGLDLSRALPDLVAGRQLSLRDPARKIDLDEVRLQGLTGKPLQEQGIKFGELVVGVSRSADRMNERVTMRLAGLELGGGTSPTSELTQGLAAVGYKSLPINWTCEGANDYAKQTSMVDKCDLVADGAATLSLTYMLGGLKADTPATTDTDAAMAAFQQMEIVRFQLSVRDRSLLERLLAFGAQQQGKTPAAMRAELVQQIRLGSAGFTQGSARLQEAVQALVAFVNKPGALTIELAPATPVKISEFNPVMAADPAGTAEKLGLKVRSAP
jgi:hypothetical protein